MECLTRDKINELPEILRVEQVEHGISQRSDREIDIYRQRDKCKWYIAHRSFFLQQDIENDRYDIENRSQVICQGEPGNEEYHGNKSIISRNVQ